MLERLKIELWKTLDWAACSVYKLTQNRLAQMEGIMSPGNVLWESGPKFSPRAVANELLHIARCRHAKLTPLKLQKLLYFAYGWHLATFDQQLFNDHIEAWEYGPVIPSIYADMKKYGPEDIPDSCKNSDGTTPRIDEERNEDTIGLLKEVWGVYGGLSAWHLSALTHEPGTPWDKTEKSKFTIGENSIIDPTLIKEHFLNLKSGGP